MTVLITFALTHSQGQGLVDHIYFYKDGWLADAEENGDLVTEILSKGQHVCATHQYCDKACFNQSINCQLF